MTAKVIERPYFPQIIPQTLPGVQNAFGSLVKVLMETTSRHGFAINEIIDEIGFTQAGTGAFLRTPQGKMRDFISVLDFIPVAEHAGIRDRTTTTDVATYVIVAVAVIKTLGGTLYFPPGLYLIGQSINISEEGVILQGAGRDVLSNTTGTVLRTTAAIPLFAFTTPARRAVVRDMVLDGNNIGTRAADVDAPKAVFYNVTARGFTGSGLIISSFSTWIVMSDIINNSGNGVYYDNAVCNDSHILLSNVSGNAENGIRVDSSPDGIFCDHIDMENNGTDTNGTTNFAHVLLSGSVVNANFTNMYHESDNGQSGFASQLIYDVGAGMQGFHLSNFRISVDPTKKLNFLIKVGASALDAAINDGTVNGYNTAVIDNKVGASGSLMVENVPTIGDTGFQAKLVDYAGAPTTAGQGLHAQVARHYARMYKNADQTFTSATPATWTMASSSLDGASLVVGGSNGILIKDEGLYQADLNLTFSNYTAGDIAKMEVLVNGVVVFSKRVELGAAAAASISGNISGIFKADANHLVTVKVGRTTNNIDVFGDDQFSNLSIHKIGVDTL